MCVAPPCSPCFCFLLFFFNWTQTLTDTSPGATLSLYRHIINYYTATPNSPLPNRHGQVFVQHGTGAVTVLYPDFPEPQFWEIVPQPRPTSKCPSSNKSHEKKTNSNTLVSGCSTGGALAASFRITHDTANQHSLLRCLYTYTELTRLILSWTAHWLL